MTDPTAIPKYNSFIHILASLLSKFRQESAGSNTRILQHLRNIENIVSATYIPNRSIDAETAGLFQQPSTNKTRPPSSSTPPSRPGHDNLLLDALGWLDKELEVPYSIDERTVKLRPGSTQWGNFPNLIQTAAKLGAEKVGVVKVSIT